MIALLLAWVSGFPLALRLYRDATWGALLGAAFLLGCGIVTLSLLVLSILGIPWSIPLAVIVPTLVWLSVGRALQLVPRSRGGLPAAGRAGELVLHTATLLFLLAYGAFATVAPVWELDFIDNWGLKGRVFYLARGLDWRFLESPWYRWSHQDYPPLVPLLYDYVSLFRGHWDDRTPSLFYALAAGAALLIVSALLEEETGSPLGASFGTLILAFFVATPWIGLADGPLIAFGLTGLLLVRSGRIPLGATLLGFAAFTKNEGLTLVIATAIALAIEHGPRSVLRLWPALAIPLPWQLLRAFHDIPTDLATGSIASRALAHLQHPDEYLRLLMSHAGIRPILWLGILAAFLLGWKRRPVRFLLIVAALQFAAYIGAYLVTPLDVEFHIRWSWDRLVWHLIPIVVFAALATLLPATRATPKSSSASP